VVAVVQTAMLSDIADSKLHDAVITHPTMAEALNLLFSTVPPRDASR
jgi:pyruvate/2-oxoglutarate dehydrogenase complex dihydrolipoamide dehydrogenase (E3) component